MVPQPNIKELIDSYVQLPCRHFVISTFIEIAGRIEVPRRCGTCGQYFLPDTVKAFYFNLPPPESASIKERILEDHNGKLKKLNRKLIEEIKKFKQNSDEHALVCKELIEENFNIKQQNNKLMSEIKKEINRTAKEMKKREKLETDLNKIKADVAKLEKTIKKLTTVETENASKIKELKKQLKTKNVEIDNLTQTIREFKEIIFKSEEKLYQMSELKREIDRHKGTNSCQRLDNKKLSEKITLLTDKNTTLSEELLALQTQHQQLTTINANLHHHYCMLYIELINKTAIICPPPIISN